MKCIDCAWLEDNFIKGQHMTHCNNPNILLSRTAMLSPDKERKEDCEYFLQKEGISAYDALNDEEKHQLRYKFEDGYEKYRRINESQGIRAEIKEEFVINGVQSVINMDNARWKYFLNMWGLNDGDG